MMIGTILGWMIAGLVVGLLARAILPGRQSMGLLMTMALGIVGAFVGGFIGSMFFGPNLTTDATGMYAVETAWPGWIMAVLGGILILGLVSAVSSRGDRLT